MKNIFICVFGCMFLSFLLGSALLAQSSFPAFPPKNVTATQDRDQMMEQVGVKFPAVPPPPRIEDKNAEPNTWPVDKNNPEGNWTDAGNHVISRSSFGLWNNYDEAISGTYTPIDLLKMKDGTVINTSAEWWSKRRPEIFNAVQKEIWGSIPAENTLPKVTFYVKTTAGGKGNTAYIQKEITGEIDISRYPQVKDKPVISAVLRIPANATEAVPVMIIYGGASGLDTYWARTSPNGWGVCMYNPNALQPDNGAGLTSYLIGLVNQGNWRKPDDWGSLVAWAWGIGRLIDYFETDKQVDAKKIGVAGHSRYGKGTMVAMAYEPRVAISFPSCGGALGPSMVRRHWGQDLENIGWDREYHWAAGNFFKYMGPLKDGTYKPRKVELLTVDAHSLIALSAPRPVFLNGGTQDGWSDPYGTYLAGKGATPVYELLGKKGVVMNDPTPIDDKAYLDGMIAFRNHIGGHTDAPEWPSFFEFAAKFIKTGILQLPVNSVALSNNPVPAEVKLRTNETFAITGAPAWLTVSKSEIKNNEAIITLMPAKNTGASARSATLEIKSRGKMQTLVVHQASATPSLTVGAETIGVGEKENAEGSLTVSSNTAYTIKHKANWLSVDETSANNNSLSLTVLANPGTEKRMDTIVVSATGVPSRNVIVTQAGGAPTLNVSVTATELNASANSSAPFVINSNSKWTIESSEPWIKPSITTGGPGFAQVTLVATENTGGPRNTTLTVKVNGLAPSIIQVRQKAK